MMKNFQPTQSRQLWYLNLAPQFCSLVDADLSGHFSRLKKVKGTSDLFVCEAINHSFDGALLSPQKVSPFIRSAWHQDHLWPGALKVTDFVDRTSRWAAGQLRNHKIAAVSIETSFEDKAKLKVQIRKTLDRFASGDPDLKFSFEPAPGSDGKSLFILLTPEALVSCRQSYVEHGLIKALPPEIGGRMRIERRHPQVSIQKAFAERVNDQSNHLSRAAKKATESLGHASRMRWISKPLADCHFIDLGASPGGISFALAQLCKKVTAIDRAPLASEVANLENVEFCNGDIREMAPPVLSYDGLVCDMNGDSVAAAECVCRFATALSLGSLIFFTLKIARIEGWKRDLAHVSAIFASHGLMHLDTKHLFHNRNELTLFLKKT